MSNTPRKRALFVIPADVANGAERVTANYALALAKLPDWEVTFQVICSRRSPSFGDTLTSSGIIVRYGPYPRERLAMPAFMLSLGKQDYDLVFSSILHINGLLCAARRLGHLRTKRLVTRESNVFADRYVGLERRFRALFLKAYGAQERIIVQTNKMGASLRPLLGEEAGNTIQVVPNPLDVSGAIARAAAPIEPELGQRLANKPHILWMGRLIDWKRPGIAVDVLRILRKEFGLDVGLVLLGDGPLRNQVALQIDEAGLRNDVVALGRVDNPLPFARLCTVGISTSLALEGFPNVLLEMMASGIRAVVATPCADGVQELPGISVTDGFSAEEIASRVAAAIEEKADYRQTYEAEISTRSATSTLHYLIQ